MTPQPHELAQSYDDQRLNEAMTHDVIDYVEMDDDEQIETVLWLILAA